MVADLKRSGLTDTDARKLGYKVLSPKQTKDLTDDKDNYVASYLIPYYGVDDEPTDFWRVRFLEEVTGPFQTIKKKPRRYSQTDDALPRFYFPRNAPFDWTELVKTPSVSLIITEGEKKAAKACKETLPTISVGGVWAWRSKKKGVAAIPDFDLIEWKDRDVHLCFDNDVMVKPLVIGALNALAHELTKRGAKVYVIHLPKGQNTNKLDDYLVKRSAKAFFKLKPEPYAESAELWKLNERLAFVNAVGGVWDYTISRFHKNKSDLEFQYGNWTYTVPKANGEGLITKSAPAEWIKWAHRREYSDITYLPGASFVVDNKINTWPGWKVEAKKGDVRPVMALIDYLLSDYAEWKEWFLHWLAYPIQYPGTKLYTATLIWSQQQGVGKSLLAEIIGDIYGDNYAEISRENLTRDFNAYAKNKQFIQGDEITGSTSRDFADKIKGIVTRRSVEINEKYQPTYFLPDCANYYLTSNHLDALFVEDDDRRYFVVEVIEPKRDDDFYADLRRWRDEPSPENPNGQYKGVAAFRWYLETEIDVSKFKPYAEAPITKAKTAMISFSQSEADLFAERLRDDPDATLTFGRTTLIDEILTLEQLHAFYAPGSVAAHKSKIALSKALIRKGFIKKKVRVGTGTKWLWAVRNILVWARRQPYEWADVFAKQDKGRKIR